MTHNIKFYLDRVVVCSFRLQQICLYTPFLQKPPEWLFLLSFSGRLRRRKFHYIPFSSIPPTHNPLQLDFILKLIMWVNLIIFIQHSRKVKMLILLPGHGCRPQFSVNFVSPSHCFPPYVACITISRLLVLNADVPHVALHDPSDQGPNLQSTKDKLELLARL